jgi:heparan-alpha-glucosaminide N-acetyltransferase
MSATPTAQRVASIDIFRGLTMAVMIFVNELAGVHGLPWWTYHAHAQEDVMTYVDMVFPFFLFIVGMSMPLAVERRLQQNPSYASLWLHVISRSCGLVVLGLILANADSVDPHVMVVPVSSGAWTLMGLFGGIFFWLVPSRKAEHRRIYLALRGVGLLLLIFVYAIFRRVTGGGGIGWIDGSYPEILGLIGYTYFSVALLYIPSRRWTWAPFVWFAVLVTFCDLTIAHVFNWPARVPLYVWPFGNAAHPAITMAGIATSTLFLRSNAGRTHDRRILLALGFGIATLVAAWLLAPLGISKIRATPTWVLVSAGAAVLAFVLLYWVCDMQGKTRWATFVKSAGENTLLTYLLPDLYYAFAGFIGFTYFDHHLTFGMPGVLRAVCFTAVILAISTLLTRWRIRLQL